MAESTSPLPSLSRQLLAPAPSASPLLTLPGELREAVYTFYFAHDPTIPPPHISRSPLALALTCRQLYNETHARAFVATTFKAQCWHLWQLKARFQRVPLAVRPYIKRLEITVQVNDFLKHRSSTYGLKFADACLTGLKELYIQYTGQPKSGSGETYIISNLEVVLWKTVVKCRNERLQKIRIVHGGAFRELTINQLCERMHSWLPLAWAEDEAWETRQQFDEGRFHLIKRRPDGTEQRDVIILLGNTVREAEKYRTVREELLKGKVLDNVRARQPDRKEATDMDNEALAFEIDQLCRDFDLANQIDTSSYY